MAADNISKQMLTRWEAAHAAGKIPDPNIVCCSSNRCLHGLLQRDYGFVEKLYAPLHKLTVALQRKDKQAASASLPPVPRNSKKQFAIKLGDDSSSSSCGSAGGAAGSSCSCTVAAASDGACCMLRLPCHMSCNTKT